MSPIGLDMYLSAKREFAPDSPEAAVILTEAGITLDELKQFAANDPREKETSVYLSRWEFTDEAERTRATAVEKAAGLLSMSTEDSHGGELRWANDAVSVSIICIYWRKANAVHAWFVDNCQGGTDDCGDHPVDIDKLIQLRSTCTAALHAYEHGRPEEASRLMTPRGGFFFGDTSIGPWYAEDLTTTVTGIDRVLGLATQLSGVSFEYHSSW